MAMLRPRVLLLRLLPMLRLVLSLRFLLLMPRPLALSLPLMLLRPLPLLLMLRLARFPRVLPSLQRFRRSRMRHIMMLRFAV